MKQILFSRTTRFVAEGYRKEIDKITRLETPINESRFRGKRSRIERVSRRSRESKYQEHTIVYVLLSGWQTQRKCARASSHVGKQTEQTIGRVCPLGYGRRCESGQSVISILRHGMNEWFVFVRKLQRDTRYSQMHMQIRMDICDRQTVALVVVARARCWTLPRYFTVTLMLTL